MPHILLIDDDDLFRPMIRATLEELGHTVTEACNGKQGLALYRSDVFDLVLSDLIMPEKEGLEVIMELRKEFPSVRIIAMSGGGRVSAADYLHIAKLMGAGKVLAKPFSSQELTAAMAEMLG